MLSQIDREKQARATQLFRVDDVSEETDLAEREPQVLQGIVETVEQLRENQTSAPLGGPTPVLTGPGGPVGALPDNNPPRGQPYAESEWQATP